MGGVTVNPIVATALSLAGQHPDWPSLQVLDAAMAGHEGTHPDFEVSGPSFSDWLDPPSPFAELVRRAFGMHVDPADFSADPDCWQAVIDSFAARYALWR
ncbi:hypothetical protein [Rubrivivax gelatinosus]|uniref:hypothetical protein n=1 Tax=Rubrivivax gelatinosus TaxID=28068 RepID=UPI0005C21A99|nr:hypothetical protein [Rubrivivax gelatinosus]MBG6082977.1 hypothetical protein [Rubrivivax gelatinosus]